MSENTGNKYNDDVENVEVHAQRRLRPEKTEEERKGKKEFCFDGALGDLYINVHISAVEWDRG